MTISTKNPRKRANSAAEPKAIALVSTDLRLTGPAGAAPLPVAEAAAATLAMQKPARKQGRKAKSEGRAEALRKAVEVPIPQDFATTRVPEATPPEPSPAVAPFKSAPAAVTAKPAAAPPYDDLAALNRRNFVAAAKTGAAMSDALETVGRMFLSLAQSSLQKAAKTAEQLMLARTLDDVIHVNTQFAMDTVETLVERGAAISQTGADLAHKSLAPWRGQVEANFANLLKPVASKPPLG